MRNLASKLAPDGSRTGRENQPAPSTGTPRDRRPQRALQSQRQRKPSHSTPRGKRYFRAEVSLACLNAQQLQIILIGNSDVIGKNPDAATLPGKLETKRTIGAHCLIEMVANIHHDVIQLGNGIYHKNSINRLYVPINVNRSAQHY